MAVSDTALKASTDVQLLQQRLSELESRNSKQDSQIEVLQTQANLLKGELQGSKEATAAASNNISKYVSMAMPFLVLAIGGALYGGIADLNKSMVAAQIRDSAFDERLKITEARKSPDLTEIQANQAKFDTRITTIEATLGANAERSAGRDARLSEIGNNLAANDAKTAALDAMVGNNASRITAMQSDVSTNQKNIARIDARSGAGFVEVESQLRGILAMLSTKFDANDTKIAVLWEKVLGVKLPDTKALPLNIPAGATTTIGGSAID